MSYTANSGSAILTIDSERFPTIKEVVNTVIDNFTNNYDQEELDKEYNSLADLFEYDSDDLYCEIEKYISFDDGNDNILLTYNTEEDNSFYEVFEMIAKSLCGFMIPDYVTMNWVCDDSRDGISSGQVYLNKNGKYHDTIGHTDSELLSVREQIQEDIRSYASSIDDEGLFFTQEVLDNLCQIIVDNFDKCDT